ncbi:MAG: 4-(cytidine 5'-diphospho)-2-C-methyl-D-erythritol kinase [Pseudomonadota bacterium]
MTVDTPDARQTSDAPDAVQEHAPAKLNLYLHVGPVRGDGLHDLASLFVFADIGDVVRAERTSDAALSLEITGPFAHALARFDPSTNLVLRAAQALQRATGVGDGARLILDKQLPIAAGVGGGSADAAAALRALMRVWRVDMDPAALSTLAFSLGADVPACLARAPVYVGGAGERVSPGPALAPLWACLVNPRVETPTGPIFRAFDAAAAARAMPPAAPVFVRPSGVTLASVQALMTQSVNDLESHAIAQKPIIARAIAHLQRCSGCLAARMSGSGATVFALFTSLTAATNAVRSARAKGWWAAAGRVHR